jgi:hypothetical protein
MNDDTMHLIIVRVHEHRAASTAGKVKRVIAGAENWRRAHNRAHSRSRYNS